MRHDAATPQHRNRRRDSPRIDRKTWLTSDCDSGNADTARDERSLSREPSPALQRRIRRGSGRSEPELPRDLSYGESPRRPADFRPSERGGRLFTLLRTRSLLSSAGFLQRANSAPERPLALFAEFVDEPQDQGVAKASLRREPARRFRAVAARARLRFRGLGWEVFTAAGGTSTRHRLVRRQLARLMRLAAARA